MSDLLVSATITATTYEMDDALAVIKINTFSKHIKCERKNRERKNEKEWKT